MSAAEGASTTATATAGAPVLVSVEKGIGHLVLNRPRAINALTAEMVTLLAAALDDFAGRPEVTAVLIRGAGERGLCAGGDIRAIHADAVAGTHGAVDFWREEYRLNDRIARYPLPVVTLMSGLVLGGGVGISAHASHRIVTDSTRVGMPEVSIGFVPDVGGTHLLTRLNPALGTHVALTSGQLGSADAIAVGLADHHVPEELLPDLIAALPHGVDAAVARFARTPPPGELADADWIGECYAAPTVADILDRLDRVPAAAEAAAAIRAAAPLACTVTLRALRAAAGEDNLRRALNREFGIATVALRSHDFREGVRARIIDKDRNPRWSPADLDGVTAPMVDAHFAPRPDLEFPFPPGEGP